MYCNKARGEKPLSRENPLAHFHLRRLAIGRRLVEETLHYVCSRYLRSRERFNTRITNTVCPSLVLLPRRSIRTALLRSRPPRNFFDNLHSISRQSPLKSAVSIIN